MRCKRYIFSLRQEQTWEVVTSGWSSEVCSSGLPAPLTFLFRAVNWIRGRVRWRQIGLMVFLFTYATDVRVRGCQVGPEGRQESGGAWWRGGGEMRGGGGA